MPLTITITLFPVLIALLVLAGRAAVKDNGILDQDRTREEKWAAYEHRGKRNEQ